MSPPPSLRPRPPRPRCLTMVPSPCTGPGTPASKRRLEFLTASTPPRPAKRHAGPGGWATAREPVVEVNGRVHGDAGGGTPSPSKRRLDFPATTTPKSKRQRAGVAATPSEHPVEATRRVPSLVRGEAGEDHAGGSCRRGSGTPSKRRFDNSPYAATTPKSKRRREAGAAGGVATERLVEVIGRIRNLAADAGASALEILSGGTTVRVRGDAGGGGSREGSCWDFTLDGVSVAAEDGLEAFYARFVRSRVEGVRAGAKCTVMVYGPTASGKSHTMFGSAEQPGVVYRALRDILEGGGADGKSVQVSVLEIYNEEVYDLLAWSGRANDNGNTLNPKTKVRLEVVGRKARKATYISGNEAGTISREIALVEKRRVVKSTHCNAKSSRSHCMIIIDVPSVRGRLMLVDMAGSENIEAAGQSGHEAKSETGSINQGNTTLKRVVESIANGDSHVPFRDSKLTMLLQDSFDDERSKILMILCVSADPKELHKTVSTLEYGARTKCITRVACAPTPKDKMSSNEAQIWLKDEEVARLRKKVSMMEAREAEISVMVAAKETDIITKFAKETRNLRGEMRTMEEQMLMQQQELLAVKREKLDMEEVSHLAWRWRVFVKLAIFLQNLGWRWTPHE